MALRAALHIPRIRDEFTQAQLVVEAERVLKQPGSAVNYSQDKKDQLANILLEFSDTVRNSEGVALARQVKFVARRLIGREGEHSPVDLPEGNQWTHAWNVRFDNRPEYRIALQHSSHDWGAIKRKSRRRSKPKPKPKSRKNRR